MGFLAVGSLSWGVGFLVSALYGTIVTRAKFDRSPGRVVVVVAGASGVLAAFAAGEPTGQRVPDIVARTAFGAALVFVGSKSRRRVNMATALLLATVVTFAAFSYSTLPSNLSVALAFIAAGSATSAHIFPRRAPMLGACVALAIAQSALWLPITLPSRFPSLLTLGIAAVLLISALAAHDRRFNRRVGLVVAVVGSSCFLCAMCGVVALLGARSQVEIGIARAQGALAAGSDGDTVTAAEELSAASGALSRASNSLGSPTAKLGKFVPVLAQNMQAIDDLLESGGIVIRSAESTAKLADPSSIRTGNRFDLVKIGQLRSQVDSAETALRSVNESFVAQQSPWLLPPLKNRISSVRPDLGRALLTTVQLRDVLAGLPKLLGEARPRRYLLVIPTPSEARGSGGVIGNYGEIVADNGSLTLSAFGRTIDLLTNGVPSDQRILTAPADYEARYRQFGAPYLWPNLTMSPDFPTTAAVLADQYPQSGGQPVDGVVSIDPIGLQALLQVVGPVTVPSWPEPISGDNAAAVLLHDAYVVKGGDSKTRVALLEEVALGAWQRLTQGEIPSPGRLAANLSPAVSRRHIQVWMKDDEEQSYLNQFKVDGAVPPILGDGLGVVVANASESKIEYFLHRTIDIDTKIDPKSGGVESTVSVAFRNSAGLEGEVDYTVGAGRLTPKGTIRLYVSTYSPFSMTSAVFDGKPELMTTERELGRNVYSNWVEIPAQETKVFTFTLSGRIARPADGYRLDLFTQPLVNPDQVAFRLSTTDGSGLTGRGLFTGKGNILTAETNPSSIASFQADLDSAQK